MGATSLQKNKRQKSLRERILHHGKNLYSKKKEKMMMMKKINKDATEVLKKLSKGLKVGGSKKIDNTNGAFMPVHVEVIGKLDSVPGTGRLIAVAHYYEQNSDLVSDPEMVFLESSDEKGNLAYYPVSWEMGGYKYEPSVDIDDGVISGFRPRLQRQHAVFAGKWMDNIKRQQNL